MPWLFRAWVVGQFVFTPAMAADVTDKLLEISDVVAMLEKWEAAN